MDTTSALALPFAASNRRSIGYLQIANPGPDSTVYYGQWSLRLAERAGGPCSRDRGYAHLGLANFYQLLPDIDVAIVHLQYAVAALDDALPPDHPSRASLYSQLADMEADRGRFDDALTATRRAFDHLRDDDPATGYGVAAEYAALLHYLGLYDEALYWDRRSLAYARAGFGADNAFLAAPSLSAAVAASYAGDTALAAGLMDSALLILDRHPAETDFVRPDYHAARGTNALARGDYDVARDAFLESLRIIRAREDADGLMLRTGLHNLINVYLQRAELDSAAAYYARLEAVLAEAEDVPGTSVNSMQHRRLGAELAVAGGDFARARDVLAELYGEVSSSSGRGGYLSLSFDLADAAARLADSSGRAADGALLLDYAALVERAIDEEYAFLGAERWDEGFTESLRRVFTAAAFATAERAAAATGPVADSLRRRATRLADLPRALLLRRRGAEAVAARSTALPDSVAGRGRRLRQRLYAVRHTEKDSLTRERALADIREQIAVHEDELRRGYPGYYRALANPLKLDVDALRARAAATDTRYVSYLTDTARGRVLITAVTGGAVETHVRPFGERESTGALALKRNVALGPGGADDALVAEATALYEWLVLPALGPGAVLPARLVISGDGPLADLPFVALLTRLPGATGAGGAALRRGPRPMASRTTTPPRTTGSGPG